MKSPIKYVRKKLGNKHSSRYWYDGYHFSIHYAKHIKQLRYKVKGGYDDSSPKNTDM